MIDPRVGHEEPQRTEAHQYDDDRPPNASPGPSRVMATVAIRPSIVALTARDCQYMWPDGDGGHHRGISPSIPGGYSTVRVAQAGRMIEAPDSIRHAVFWAMPRRPSLWRVPDRTP